MASAGPEPKILVIVGPTASGKSELAMRLAKDFDGEIICADSRTIYIGLDIGTAKPSAADCELVPHWGLDLVKPGKAYSAARFKAYAEAKIAEIQARGKLPVVVGGTGLYVDGLLYDFSFINNRTWRRWAYSWWSVDKLQKMIQQRDWPLPENSRNRRHLVRTLERRGQVGSKKNDLPANIILIGLLPTDSVLKERIAKRSEAMFRQGIIEETANLSAKYRRKKLAASAVIYKVILRLIDGEITQSEALEELKTADWRYARRQKTWFKRNPDIKWFNGPEAAYKVVKKELLNT